PAFGQGPRVPDRVPGRPRGRPVPECEIDRGTRSPRRGTPARVRRHHARTPAPDPELRGIAAPARSGDIWTSFAIPARDSGRIAARGASPRAGQPSTRGNAP